MAFELTDDMLVRWQEEARSHPSGQRCDGVHSATADRRVIVLVDEIRRLQGQVAAYRGVAIEKELELRGEEPRVIARLTIPKDSIKVGDVLHFPPKKET